MIPLYCSESGRSRRAKIRFDAFFMDASSIFLSIASYVSARLVGAVKIKNICNFLLLRIRISDSYCR